MSATGWEGETLDNGAVVVDLTLQGERDGVVLCMWKNSPHKYVVWACGFPSTTELVPFRGSYHASLPAALAAYESRGGKP